MKTLKSKNLILLTSFLSAAILSFVVISPAIADIKQGTDLHTNCVATVFPDNVERDIVVDADGGLIFVKYEENGVMKEITLSLKGDAKFSECTDGVRELVSVAKKYSDKIDADNCKELKGITSGVQPIPSIEGKKLDMKAANNYISNHCQ